jgi:hypothetical protein
MDISEFNVTDPVKSKKRLTMARNDFPLTVQYGETTYILVVTKSEKLLLQKPLV